MDKQIGINDLDKHTSKSRNNVQIGIRSLFGRENNYSSLRRNSHPGGVLGPACGGPNGNTLKSCGNWEELQKP